jgi:hypothetical protein
MPRKPPIKWRESDAEKLAREIERFNAKIYRTRNRHPELKSILPETIKKEDKQKLIQELRAQTRSEFNKAIKSLERFSRKGAEQAITSKTGNTVTKWEKREVGIKVAQINRERTRQRKIAENMEVTSRGQSVGMKRGEMGSERMNELRPKKFNFDKIKGGKEWEKFKASVDRQASYEDKLEKMETYKRNYLKGLDSYGGYADHIKAIVEGLPAELVVEIYYKEQEATITFHYEKQDMDAKLDVLERIWNDVNEEYENETNRRL